LADKQFSIICFVCPHSEIGIGVAQAVEKHDMRVDGELRLNLLEYLRCFFRGRMF
jgi:hypothetical protein